MDKLAPQAIIWRVWGSPGNPLSIPSADLGPALIPHWVGSQDPAPCASGQLEGGS